MHPGITTMPVDYSGAKLRNRSFAHKDLSNVNFRNADLRGADFSSSNLHGAVFESCLTGISPLRSMSILAISIIASIGVGIVSAWSVENLRALFQSPEKRFVYAGVVSVVEFLAFAIVLFRFGLKQALATAFSFGVILFLALGVLILALGAGPGTAAFSVVVSVILMTATLLLSILVRSLGGMLGNVLFIVVAVSGALAGKWAGARFAGAFIAILSAIMAKQAVQGNPKFEAIRKTGFKVLGKYGTSFRNADLTDASFDHSSLRNCDFRNATLRNTRFNQLKKFESCRFDGTGRKAA